MLDPDPVRQPEVADDAAPATRSHRHPAAEGNTFVAGIGSRQPLPPSQRRRHGQHGRRVSAAREADQAWWTEQRREDRLLQRVPRWIGADGLDRRAAGIASSLRRRRRSRRSEAPSPRRCRASQRPAVTAPAGSAREMRAPADRPRRRARRAPEIRARAPSPRWLSARGSPWAASQRCLTSARSRQVGCSRRSSASTPRTAEAGNRGGPGSSMSLTSPRASARRAVRSAARPPCSAQAWRDPADASRSQQPLLGEARQERIGIGLGGRLLDLVGVEQRLDQLVSRGAASASIRHSSAPDPLRVRYVASRPSRTTMSLSISRHSRSSVRSRRVILGSSLSLIRSCWDWGRGASAIARRVRRIASAQRSPPRGRAASVNIRVALPSARRRVRRQAAHRPCPARQVRLEHGPLADGGEVPRPYPQAPVPSRTCPSSASAAAIVVRHTRRKPPAARELAREVAVLHRARARRSRRSDPAAAASGCVRPAVRGEQDRVRGRHGASRPAIPVALGWVSSSSSPRVRGRQARRGRFASRCNSMNSGNPGQASGRRWCAPS